MRDVSRADVLTMPRPEFTRTTKLAAWDRCKGRCETTVNNKPVGGCGRKIFPGDGPEYDHIIAAALGGDNSLNNCAVLCIWCHQAKTTSEDMPAIVKGRKIRAQHANAKTPRRKIPYRLFNGDGVDPNRRAKG